MKPNNLGIDMNQIIPPPPSDGLPIVADRLTPDHVRCLIKAGSDPDKLRLQFNQTLVRQMLKVAALLEAIGTPKAVMLAKDVKKAVVNLEPVFSPVLSRRENMKRKPTDKIWCCRKQHEPYRAGVHHRAPLVCTCGHWPRPGQIGTSQGWNQHYAWAKKFAGTNKRFAQ